LDQEGEASRKGVGICWIFCYWLSYERALAFPTLPFGRCYSTRVSPTVSVRSRYLHHTSRANRLEADAGFTRVFVGLFGFLSWTELRLVQVPQTKALERDRSWATYTPRFGCSNTVNLVSSIVWCLHVCIDKFACLRVTFEKDLQGALDIRSMSALE
jgi:hypothetical protein